MALLRFFREKKTNSETERRERLLRNGRITEGRILDCDEEVTQVFYIYSVNGADYESSELLTEDQRLRPENYAPGAKVSIRFDPRQPGNSIVV
ncbi:MAG: hypothetical protein M3209_12950 [Acidobacteriota bacterium]|nr:hypothetical protein [Acidobacteriota bacterium]